MNDSTSRIDVLPIVVQYVSTFKKYRSSGYDRPSLSLFLILPLTIGILLPAAHVIVDKDLSALLLGLYSVFAGLFFGTQIFIFDVISRVVELSLTLQASRLRVKKLEALSYNVSFEILICFSGLITLFLLSLIKQKTIVLILSGLSFYFLSLFILSLLSSVKGLHVLLSEEISIQNDAIERKFIKSP